MQGLRNRATASSKINNLYPNLPDTEGGERVSVPRTANGNTSGVGRRGTRSWELEVRNCTSEREIEDLPKLLSRIGSENKAGLYSNVKQFLSRKLLQDLNDILQAKNIAIIFASVFNGIHVSKVNHSDIDLGLGRGA